MHSARSPTARRPVPGPVRTSFAPMAEQIEYGTSHISIVDAEGRAVSMTTTIEDAFGARQMVRGFLLNNELSDFSFAPADATGRPVVNRVEPASALVDGADPGLPRAGWLPVPQPRRRADHPLHRAHAARPAAVAARPAGRHRPAHSAPPAGRWCWRKGRFPAPVIEALKARGHEVREQDMTSGLQAIARGTQDGRTVWRAAPIRGAKAWCWATEARAGAGPAGCPPAPAQRQPARHHRQRHERHRHAGARVAAPVDRDAARSGIHHDEVGDRADVISRLPAIVLTSASVTPT